MADIVINIPDSQKEKVRLIEELAKEDAMVLSQAYIYAKNLVMYGENVAEKWNTVTQQSAILEKAYARGYYEAMERMKDANKRSEVEGSEEVRRVAQGQLQELSFEV